MENDFQKKSAEFIVKHIQNDLCTEHLTVFKIVKDEQSPLITYQVFDENHTKPVIIYFSKDNIYINEELPDDDHLTDYEYIYELAEVIKKLNQICHK